MQLTADVAPAAWARGINITVTPPPVLGEMWEEANKLYDEIFLKGKTVR